MKNLLTGILIIATLFLSSCKNLFGDKFIIVSSSKDGNNCCNCVYEIETFGINIDWYSKCGYKVGDTIKLTKY